MPQFALKYADSRGEIRQQVMEAGSEQEVRDRLTQQGYLIYSVRKKTAIGGFSGGLRGGSKKLDMDKFLIFNQQFVTLFKAGLPILKALDLLADRLTDAKLGPYINEVRDDVKKGSLLSDAFKRQGLFPPIYVTSIMAGEKSGALGEVLERYVNYQRLALAVRKKILVSLMYPAVLMTLVVLLVVFLVTFVVPRFAELYSTTSAQLPYLTRLLIAVGTTAKNYILFATIAAVGVVIALRLYLKTEAGQILSDRVKLKIPVLNEIWLKYQVAQVARLLSTILTGGIPLVQGLETSGESLGSPLLRNALATAQRGVKEGQPLSRSLQSTKIFPPLAIDMMEVGESTGALPAMLGSVAEFYEEDVNTRMTAVLSLVEPVIMLIMGGFVAFVLISLYLPIFSLAESFS